MSRSVFRLERERQRCPHRVHRRRHDFTMVYIVFVNPQILGNAGMDKGAVFVATCIAAAVSALVMAFYANYPIALAPGMGLNAFFAFTVVLRVLLRGHLLPDFDRADP